MSLHNGSQVGYGIAKRRSVRKLLSQGPTSGQEEEWWPGVWADREERLYCELKYVSLHPFSLSFGLQRRVYLLLALLRGRKCCVWLRVD
jgi:hypothetical protein